MLPAPLAEDGVAGRGGAVADDGGGHDDVRVVAGNLPPERVGVLKPPGAQPDAAGGIQVHARLNAPHRRQKLDERLDVRLLGVGARQVVGVARRVAACAEPVELEKRHVVLRGQLRDPLHNVLAILRLGRADVPRVAVGLVAVLGKPGGVIVARGGRQPDPQPGLLGLQSLDERGESVGKRLGVDVPQALVHVPAVVERKGIDRLAVRLEELLAKQLDQLEAVGLGGRHERPPGVVVDEQRRVRRGRRKGLHVALARLGGSPALGDAEHGRLACEAVLERPAREMAELHQAVGVVVFTGGKLDAPEGVVHEHRLAESLVRAFVLDADQPDVDLAQGERALGRQVQAAAKERVGVAQFIDDLQSRAGRGVLHAQHEPLFGGRRLVAGLLEFEVG